jgi:hypothetical protein
MARRAFFGDLRRWCFMMRKESSWAASRVVPFGFVCERVATPTSACHWRGVINKFLVLCSSIIRATDCSAWMRAVEIGSGRPLLESLTAYLAGDLWLLNPFASVEASKGAITVNPGVTMREYSITQQAYVGEWGMSITTLSFSASRPTFPILQVVVLSICEHVHGLLFWPFLKLSEVSLA